MITFIQPVASGNALQVFVTPDPSWLKWRVLRKSTADFLGYNDTSAYKVSENNFSMIVDTVGLVNGSEYFYRDYGWNGTAWIDGNVSYSGIPATNYIDESVDVLAILKDRLNLGFKAEIASGSFFHDSNKIPVLLATPTFEDTKWPVVTLHISSDNSNGNQFIGGLSDSDFTSTDNGIIGERDGWLSSYQVIIAAWSLNADERYALKKAVKRLIIANKPVFDAAGFLDLEVSQSHIDDMQSYTCPVYRAETILNFLADSSILINYNPITAANATGIVIANGDTYV